MNGLAACTVRAVLSLFMLAGAWGVVEALCIDNRTFTSLGSSTSYIYTQGRWPEVWPTTLAYFCPTEQAYIPSTSPDLHGNFWSLSTTCSGQPTCGGDPLIGSGNDSGFLGDADAQGVWLDHDTSGGMIQATFVEGTWFTPGVDGCIDMDGFDPMGTDVDQCMAVLLSDACGTGPKGCFAVVTAPVDVFGNYDLSLPGDQAIVLAETPAPAVAGMSIPQPLKLTVDIAPVATPIQSQFLSPPCGGGEIVKGYKVYAQQRCPGRPPPEDPARDDGHPLTGWELAPGGAGASGEFIPIGDPVSITVDCAGDTDLWLALTFVLDSGFETFYVGPGATALDCGPSASSCDICETDADGDFHCGTFPGGIPGTDCDDNDAAVYPGAAQTCGDGLDNDCEHSFWPALTTTNEFDDDGDGFSECGINPGDCNDVTR